MSQLARGKTPAVTPTRVLVTILLVLPFVGMLWVSSYTHVEPRLGGFPFFYWYQILWIFLSALFTGCAYLLVKREKSGRAATSARSDDAASDGPAQEGGVR